MANEPGWYPDPWQPARRRWWDGTSWGDHTWDPNQPQRPVQPPPMWLPPPDPRRDLADEHKAAVWAKRAFTALFVTKVASGLISLMVFDSIIDDIRQASDTGTTDQTAMNGWQILNMPVTLVLILGFVGVIIWTYKAANVASKLNYPARHSTTWAILGWIVPVINFWFPYQSVRDCMAPGNSERRTVRRWWVLYLVGSFAWLAVIVVAVFAGIAIGLAVALPCIVINALELQAALRVVDAVGADHAEAIGRIVTTQ
ncbi:MAG TPA: DUF4328 domain-containing protein [Acidimicrobiales bacterium]|jgi:hypothetical protein|nr:DUF4328 domain-containing protein [Acidimicrobiales bacterium]